MQPHLCGLGIAFCTPSPYVNGPAGPRLAPITQEWHRAVSSLALPTNLNRIQVIKDGMEVGEARQSCIEDCMNPDIVRHRPEFVFFLDHDTIPAFDAVTKLLYRARHFPDYDIFAGVYCLKSSVPEPLIYKDWGVGPYWDWSVGDLLTDGITGVHMGCTLIRMSLFDRLDYKTKPAFLTENYQYIKDNAVHTNRGTEDLFFCKRAVQEVDAKILVDTSVLCGHQDQSTGIVYGLPLDSRPVMGAKWLKPDAEYKAEKKALDIGAGALKRSWDGYKTYSTDIREGLGVDYVQDTRHLNLPPEHFDLVACMAKGSPVVCRDGIKLIEDITAGDEVWTHANRWRRVTSNRRFVPSNLAKVVTAGHPQGFLVSVNHPMLMREFPNRNTGYNSSLYRSAVDEMESTKFIEARYLTRRHVAIGVIPSLVEHRDFIDLAEVIPEVADIEEYATVMSECHEAGDTVLAKRHGLSRTKVRGWIYHGKVPFGYHVSDDAITFHNTREEVVLPRLIPVDRDLMRLIGYYLSDGSLSRTSRPHVGFHFSTSEAEFVNDVVRIVSDKFNISPTDVRQTEGTKGLNIRYASRVMHDVITGLIGAGDVYEKKIPAWALWESPELQRELIEGIVRGDGCVNSRGRSSVTTVSKDLAEGLRLLVLRCGEKANVSHIKTERKPEGSPFRSCGWRYEVSWCPERMTSHGGLIHDGVLASRVWSIETVPNTNGIPVYGLQVEEDESYFASGVTQHNSSHHLEHIPRWEQEEVWKQIFLITKPGGKIEHIVPSVEWAGHKLAAGEMDEHVMNVLYGAQEEHGYSREFNLHYFGYTKSVGKALAEQAGFVDVTCEDWRDDEGRGYNLIIRGRKALEDEIQIVSDDVAIVADDAMVD